MNVPERLPEDIEAERSLLSTICASGNEAAASEVGATLEPEAFVHPAHRVVFVAMREILRENGEIHAVALKEKLVTAGLLNTVGGFPGLIDLLSGDEVGKPENLVAILKRKLRQRQLIRLAAQLMRQAACEEAPPEELVERASLDLLRICQGRDKKNLVLIGEVGAGAIHHIQEVGAGRIRGGIPTGIPKLDWMLGGGFKPGQLIILAARPGIGKSALATQIAEHAARRHATSAIWNLEMSAQEVWVRMAGRLAGIPSYQVASGKLTYSEMERLQDAKADLQALPLLINDQAEITALEIRAQLDHAMVTHGTLGLAVVDYLQLLTSVADSNKQKSEATRIGEISRALKLMAKDRATPFLVLSQLNREVEKRSGGRPMLSDLRDSGALEQDADIVLFIHRRQNPGGEQESMVELIVAKHRNGPLGTIHLQNDQASYTFKEVERTTMDEPLLVKKGEEWRR